MMLQIEPAWILLRQVRLNPQRLVDLPQRPFVGLRERVASRLGRVPIRRYERTAGRASRQGDSRSCP